MKAKHLVITILFFIGTVSIQAQRGERPDPKTQAKTTTEAYTKAFELSDEQKDKTYKILLASNENRMKKMQELMSSGDRDGMRAAFTKMQEETDKELKKVFTEDQWAKYEKWKKDNANRRGPRGGN